jgi:hypothetical protein
MPPSLAVLLDEQLPPGGELQIKRGTSWREPGWELIVWEPVKGSRFPRAVTRLQARTSLELVEKLEERGDGGTRRPDQHG